MFILSRLCGEKPGTGHLLPSTIPTGKDGGGSIVLWGCFSAAVTGQLVQFEGKINAVKYINILGGNLSWTQTGLRFHLITEQ